MKLIKWLTSWGEKLAAIWARYWLLLFASGFVLLSAVLKWVEFPFSRNLKGLQLPLFHDAGLIPHLTLFSFGFLGVAVLIGGVIFSRFSTGFLGAAAAVLLTIFALAPAHLAFAQPTMLQRLTEEAEVTPLIKAFSRTYLPQNYGVAEDIPKRLILYSGWGRFVAAWSFLRLGWYCLGIGALLLGGYAIIRLRDQKLSIVFALFGLPLAALVIVLAPAMLGQYYYTRASLDKAEGRNEEAIAAFRKSMTWDSWHSQDIELYATIGELQRLSGVSEDSPERHISRAAHLEKANQYEQAIFELETAAKTGGAIGVTARRETARLHMMFGLALYQAGGVGSAVTNWQQALAVDPTQFYSLPYLARGYFEIGSYQAAVQTVDQVIKIVKDHNSLLGDAYSLGGDSYAKLGEVAEARKYYNLSLLADPIENYWALTGLVGE